MRQTDLISFVNNTELLGKVGGLIALLQWDENYGENENAEGPCRWPYHPKATPLPKAAVHL